MSEDLGKEMAIEAAKAVAVEGYKDTLQPSFKAIGGIVALPFRAIDAALSKPKLWVEEKYYNYERTRQLLAEKLQHTPEELIVPPENYVAVPALQQIAYCFDSDELRDMYANLLANSMNKIVKNGVHPGFVEIIKQLSPDEAKILKYMYFCAKANAIPVVYPNIYKADGRSVSGNIFTNVAEICECECSQDHREFMDNMGRLGLLRCSTTLQLVDKSVYGTLEKHPYLKELEKHLKETNKITKIDFKRGYAELTDFGRSFCAICLETKIIMQSQESGS